MPIDRPPRRPTPTRRATTAATLLALALVCAAPAGAQGSAKASKLYEDALVRWEKKDVPGAIIQLRNALKIDRNMLPVHVLLGRALLANGEVSAAEVALTDAIRMGVDRTEIVVPLAQSVIQQGKLPSLLSDPRFSPAGLPAAVQVEMLLLRAGAATDSGDSKAGLAQIMEARAVQPGNPATWSAEVPVRLRSREFAAAVAAADKALELAPTDAESHYTRGQVAHLQGDVPGALARYGRALELQGDHVEALVSRAGVLLDLRRIAEARADVGRLIAASPRDPRGHYMSAVMAEASGDKVAARTALSQVVAVLDGIPIDYFRYRPQALILGGLAHYGLGQKERALPYLEAAQRAQPNTPISKLLAQIHLGDKNYDRAIDSLNSYLRAFPGDTQALLLLSSAHMAQGRHARATQLMTDALRIQDRPDLRTMLGMSLVGGGKFKEASAEFEASLKVDNTQLQPGVALATLHLQSRQPARAARVTEPLVKAHPRNAGVQNLHGMALAGIGQAAAARRAFEAALTLDRGFLPAKVNLARLKVAEGNDEAASADLNAVLAADDKNREALDELARLHERAGRTADAQRLLEKAEDLSPLGDPVAGVALIDFHLRGNRLDGARDAVKRVTAKAPDSLPVLVASARVSLAAGDLPQARSQLSRASGVAQFNPGLLLQVALLQNAALDHKGAQHSLNKALQERPGDLPSLALLAEVEMRLGDFASAEARARQILTRHPGLALGHGLMGDLALARGQRPAAIEAFRKALQVEPSTESLIRLHNAVLPTDAGGALQIAEQWLRNRPGDTRVRRLAADGHARAGNWQASRAAYEALLKKQPDNIEALNNLANVLISQGSPEALAEALKVAERAQQLNRAGVPHIMGTLGWAAFKAGQTDRALQLLRDARLRDPNNADTRYFLGAVLASAGRKAEARGELEEAIRSGRLSSAKEAQSLLQTLR
jgi:putative PEP-CTERM system TPR-repeat lipoprotein